MRPYFGETIRQYRDLAKDKIKLEEERKQKNIGEQENNLSKSEIIQKAQELREKQYSGNISYEEDLEYKLLQINMAIEKAVELRSSGFGKESVKEHQEIFDIQIKKQEIMKNLREYIAKIDKLGAAKKNNKVVKHTANKSGDKYRIQGEDDKMEEIIFEKQHKKRIIAKKEDGKENYFWKNWSGKEESVTIGELLTDGEWGVGYYLDPETTGRNIRKKYAIGQTKEQLSYWLDKQIVKNAMVNPDFHTQKYQTKLEAYKALGKKLEQEEKGGEMNDGGRIAEKIVYTFFKKLTYDFPELGFFVIKTDVEDDIEYKSDFIIRLFTSQDSEVQKELEIETQNVKAGTNQGAEDIVIKKIPKEVIVKNIGIQFTTIPEDSKDISLLEKLEIKKRQLDNVQITLKRDKRFHEKGPKLDDVILVSVHLDLVKNMYRKWNGDKKPGGPEKLLSESQKEKIIKGVLSQKCDKKTIETIWQKVQSMQVY